jgi:hypothetical protein
VGIRHTLYAIFDMEPESSTCILGQCLIQRQSCPYPSVSYSQSTRKQDNLRRVKSGLLQLQTRDYLLAGQADVVCTTTLCNDQKLLCCFTRCMPMVYKVDSVFPTVTS